MEANDYRKTREVLAHVHEFLSNLCRDARCDAHCSECIGASDLADDVYNVLHTPPRNCDAFSKAEVLKVLEDRSFPKEDTIEWLYSTAEEQEEENNGRK